MVSKNAVKAHTPSSPDLIWPDSNGLVKAKAGRYRLLGYRCICEAVGVDALRDSWLWVPQESRSRFKPYRVMQVGRYKITPRRVDLGVRAGMTVLVDTSMGSVDIEDGGKKLKLISLHDVAAVIETAPNLSED